MSTLVALNPVTRIEGHLAIHAETESVEENGRSIHRVSTARCGGEMYRGIEQILRGRDPLDAQQIAQRICGVCPISHGMASIRAQEDAYGITPSHNGRLLQNLILSANYLQSHILHFYMLAALDYVDVTAILKYEGKDRGLLAVKAWVSDALARSDSFPAAPFLPRLEAEYVKSHDRNITLLAHYVEALEMRRTCHEMAAVFGARVPHSTAIIPGGCTQTPSMERVVSYAARLKRIQAFIDEVYIPDLCEVAAEFPEYAEIGRGYGDMLCYGVFEMNDAGQRFYQPGALIDGRWEALNVAEIREETACSKYAGTAPLHPSTGETEPQPGKSGAYTWIKAPRYKSRPMEVGPLARVLTNYYNPTQTRFKTDVDALLQSLSLEPKQLVSVIGRHVARGLEARWIARQAEAWLDELRIDEPATRPFQVPKSGKGVGLVEAPRGALGHWLTIENYCIKNYQCIVPTTWNCSPRDGSGNSGPVEHALEGTLVANPEQPMELGRIVRSFDPCLACAIH